jgi:hypothetical protein
MGNVALLHSSDVGQSISLCEVSFQKGPADALSDGGVFRFAPRSPQVELWFRCKLTE